MTDPRRSLAALRYLAVVVSFAHMAATILLYSSRDWLAQAVAAGMTLLIDLVTIKLIEYRIAATWKVSRWISGFLGLSLILSVALNGVYLWRYRPTDVDATLSVAIVAALAIFVPGWIAVSATMHAEWTRHTTATATRPATPGRQRERQPRQLPASTGDTVTLTATGDKPVSKRTLQRRAQRERQRQQQEMTR